MLNEKELDEFTNEFLEEDDNLQEETPSESVDTESPDSDADDQKDESDGSTLWDGISEEQRNEVKHLQDQLALTQHAANSDRGRNKALHAKVKKLEEEAAANKAAAEAQALEVENKSDYTDKELSDMKEDLPEVSAIVSQETADLKKQIAKLESQISDSQKVPPQPPVDNQAEIDAAMNAEIAKVEAAHPKFNDIVNSVDYTTWLSRQPSGIKDMANSSTADNAIAVISMFKGAKGEKNNQDELSSMVDMPSKGLTKSNLADNDDFDAQFDHFSKQFDE